ncbi:MAG: hypothetical protein AB7F96_09150 [Beijerinckiaceae bacterium]
MQLFELLSSGIAQRHHDLVDDICFAHAFVQDVRDVGRDLWKQLSTAMQTLDTTRQVDQAGSENCTDSDKPEVHSNPENQESFTPAPIETQASDFRSACDRIEKCIDALVKLDRYERRAMALRKTAIRTYAKLSLEEDESAENSAFYSED